MAWANELTSLTPAALAGLTAVGLDEPDVLMMAFLTDDEDVEFDGAAEDLDPSGSLTGPDLRRLWDTSRKRRCTAPARLAQATLPDIDAWWHRNMTAPPSDSVAILSAESRLAPPPGRAPQARWPTRLEKRLAGATTPTAREAVEEAEWKRWSLEAVKLARDAELPLTLRLVGSERESLLATALCRNLRSSTLRKRVRDLRPLVAFLQRGYGQNWPQSAEVLLDYIAARASEPCGSTVLTSLQAALYFFEKGGGVQTDRRLTADPLIVNTIEGMQRELGSSKQAVRSAPREPVFLTAVRERMVLNEGLPTYVRAYAWWKNIQVWASLRFSDHYGLQPSSLRIAEGSLRGSLTRTKTTGPDKKHGSRAFVVSKESYLEDAAWLTVGFGLWANMLSERDYFLDLPDSTLESSLPLAASYSDASGMSRALLLRMDGPDCRRGGKGPLVLDEAASFWTEHSPRHNLPSWVGALMQVPEEWFNHLGGWTPKGASAKYVETAERRIMSMQQQVAQQLRDGRGGEDVLDEDKIWHSLDKFLIAKKTLEDDRQKQIRRLHWFRGGDEPGRVTSLFFEKALPPQDLLEDSGPSLEKSAAETVLVSDTLPADLIGQFSVSIGAKSNFRRLHLLGSCFRVPGLHYSDFEIFSERPAADKYNDFCRQCWRTEPIAQDVASSSSEEGHSS